jgi:hypothetical protein
VSHTVYLIFIKVPRDEYDEKLKYLIGGIRSRHVDFTYKPVKAHMEGLYAWTTSKKLMKEFMNTRYTKAFKVKKFDIDGKKKFKEFSSTYDGLKLEKRKFYFSLVYDNWNDDNERDDLVEGEDYLYIVSTLEERLNCSEYFEENIGEFVIGSDVDIFPDYTLFNSEIIEALDYIGYNYFYDTSIIPMICQLLDETDYTSYNFPYNVTYEELSQRYDKTRYNGDGFGITERGNYVHKPFENEVLGFIMMYSYTLFGDDG